MCFKVHVKNLHQLVGQLQDFKTWTDCYQDLQIHFSCPFANFTEANPGILNSIWFADDTLVDCYWRAKYWNKKTQPSKMVLHFTQQCTVVCALYAVCTVAWVLIRENVNSKIDGAIFEDNFIPLLQWIGCNLNEVPFEQDWASSHTHTADSVLKSSDVHCCDWKMLNC